MQIEVARLIVEEEWSLTDSDERKMKDQSAIMSKVHGHGRWALCWRLKKLDAGCRTHSS